MTDRCGFETRVNKSDNWYLLKICNKLTNKVDSTHLSYKYKDDFLSLMNVVLRKGLWQQFRTYVIQKN